MLKSAPTQRLREFYPILQLHKRFPSVWINTDYMSLVSASAHTVPGRKLATTITVLNCLQPGVQPTSSINLIAHPYIYSIGYSQRFCNHNLGFLAMTWHLNTEWSQVWPLVDRWSLVRGSTWQKRKTKSLCSPSKIGQESTKSLETKIFRWYWPHMIRQCLVNTYRAFMASATNFLWVWWWFQT